MKNRHSMRSCTEFISLHENTLGLAGYCYGCESFHLKMKGLLSVVSEVQLGVIEENLVQMQSDLETQQINDPTVGVQIKITENTFLCLSYDEVIEALELIEMAKYMKNINDLVL